METRSKPLDILRAIAILLVLGRHLTVYPGSNTFIKTIISCWIKSGWVGVDLFFVLSGFLISGLLFKEHRRFGYISFKHFFTRRGFKIYPAFYIMMLITTLILIAGQYEIRFKPLIPWLFFLQDYAGATYRNFHIWSPTWSLAVEEQFYIFLPLLLILLTKTQKHKDNPFRLIPFIFAFIGIICLGMRLYNGFTVPYNHITHLYPFHLRIDSLFFGVLISYFYYYFPLKFKTIANRFKNVFFVSGIVLLAPAFIFQLEETLFIYTVGLTTFYLGSGLILISVIGNNSKGLFTKGFAYIGSHSYSIYLWHMPVSLVGIPLFMHILGFHYGWFLHSAFYILGSLMFGIFIANIIEFPVLKLRDKLFPSRSQ